MIITKLLLIGAIVFGGFIGTREIVPPKKIQQYKISDTSILDYLTSSSYLFSRFQVWTSQSPTGLSSVYQSGNLTLDNSRFSMSISNGPGLPSLDFVIQGSTSIETLRSFKNIIFKFDGNQPSITQIRLGYATSTTNLNYLFTYVSTNYELLEDSSFVDIYGVDIPDNFASGSTLSPYNAYCISFIGNWTGKSFGVSMYSNTNDNAIYQSGIEQVLNNLSEYGLIKESDIQDLLHFQYSKGVNDGEDGVLSALSDYNLYTEQEYNTYGSLKYDEGLNDGMTSPYGITNLFVALADIPGRVLSDFLIVPVFGNTLFVILGSIITLLVAVWIIKKVSARG